MVPVDKTILSSAIITLTSTVAASALPEQYGGKSELPSPRLLIGTAITFTGLSMLGDPAPTLAGPLAAAIAVTAATWYGFPVLDNWFNNKHNPVGSAAVPHTWTPGAIVAPGGKGQGPRPT